MPGLSAKKINGAGLRIANGSVGANSPGQRSSTLTESSPGSFAEPGTGLPPSNTGRLRATQSPSIRSMRRAPLDETTAISPVTFVTGPVPGMAHLNQSPSPNTVRFPKSTPSILFCAGTSHLARTAHPSVELVSTVSSNLTPNPSPGSDCNLTAASFEGPNAQFA